VTDAGDDDHDLDMLSPVGGVPQDAGPRVLPIRLAPDPNEAFDSWLDRYAARLQTRLVDVVEAVGLSRPARTPYSRTPTPPNWMVALRGAEVARIAHATGVDTKLLAGLTLQRYDGSAVSLDLQTRRVRRSRLWGRGSGSRFCPACLAETDGRWPLTWRLSWSFCCLRHRVLLVDRCPQCGRTPRSTRPRMLQIPQPGRCSAPSPRSDRAVGAFAERCGYELAESRAEPIDTLDEILDAQMFVNRLLDRTDKAAAGGAVGGVTLSTVEVFSDLKAIAGRVLTVLAEEDLTQLPRPIREQLGSLGVAPRAEGRRAQRPGSLAPRSAARTAVAVSKAVQVVAAPDIDTAANRVGWILDRMRRRAQEVNPTTVTRSWGASSPVLQAVLLRALDSTLRPSDRLRYRTATSHPSYPQSESASDGVDARAAKLPQQLWPAWALRLMPPTGHDFLTFRRVASTALLLPGGRRPLEALHPVLGQPLRTRTFDHVMRKLADSGDLDTVARILTMLALRLDAAQAPIDYQRRRRLFGSTVLLSDSVWKACCTQADVGAAKHQRRHAERYLLELLTGSADSSHPPLGPLTTETTAAYTAFCTNLRPALAELLRAAAEQQLAKHHLDEPLTWEPPFDWVDAPTWPGPHVDSIQPAELRRLLIAERCSFTGAAATLGTTRDHVRLVLVRHPMGSLKQPDSPPQRQPATRRADDLTPEYVAYRYQQCGWSLARIAKDKQVGRRRIRQLAALAGVRIRPPGKPRQYHIDQRWLAEQYWVKGRTLVDIAAELGMHQNTVGQIARGSRSPRDSLTAGNMLNGSQPVVCPEWIRPAFNRRGGLLRVKRFLTLVNYPSYGQAGKALNVPDDVLSAQVRQLEQALGAPLLIRASMHHPLQLTEAGRRFAQDARDALANLHADYSP
jgi:hypothetical protein